MPVPPADTASPVDGSPADAARDRRAEERSPAKGTGVLLLDDGSAVEGELRDVSPSGFRIAHASSRLERGELVRFRFSGRRGVARIMWNRWSGAGGESGLYIVD